MFIVAILFPGLTPAVRLTRGNAVPCEVFFNIFLKPRLTDGHRGIHFGGEVKGRFNGEWGQERRFQAELANVWLL